MRKCFLFGAGLMAVIGCRSLASNAAVGWIGNPSANVWTQGDKKIEVMRETGEFTANTPRDAVRKDSPSKLYALKCVAGRTYTIDLSSDEVDSYLRLEDPSGKTIKEDDDSGGGKTGHDARIIFKAEAAGNYTIAATTLNKGEKGKYTLSVYHDGAGSDKEIVYLLDKKDKLTKDDPKDAGRGGTCYCKNFKIELKGGTTYVIQLNSKDFDAYLRLVDAAGKEVANDDDGAMDGLNARITYRCDKAGEYTIVATTFDRSETGEFQLRAYVKE
jgi:Bacterial pre-peptidase C-terminal domain